MELGREYFGPLWKYVSNRDITDIDYNGKEIWITNIYNERYKLNQDFVDEHMTMSYDNVICRTIYTKNCKCSKSSV